MSPIQELMQDLRAPLIGKLVLPRTKFFVPSEEFLSWMSNSFKDRLIYDVGCGVGHVSKILSKRGLKVEALDIFRRLGSEFLVTLEDATAFEFREGSVVMVCRPCHDGFAEEVFDRAANCQVFASIYVGLERNVELDLGTHRSYFSVVVKGAGRDGESVYLRRSFNDET